MVDVRAKQRKLKRKQKRKKKRKINNQQFPLLTNEMILLAQNEN